MGIIANIETDASAPVSLSEAQRLRTLLASVIRLLRDAASARDIGRVLRLAEDELQRTAIRLDANQVLSDDPAQLPSSAEAHDFGDVLLEQHIHSVEFAAEAKQRELLQFLALLCSPEIDRGVPFARLWAHHGVWRVRVEFEEQSNAVELDAAALANNTALDPCEVESTKVLATLWNALQYENSKPPGDVSANEFDALATAERLHLLADLVISGSPVSLRHPLGLVLQRTGEHGTRVLFAALSQSTSGSARRALFQAVVNLELGVQYLIGELRHSTWYVARNAVSLLGEMHALEADAALLGTLSYPDSRVRAAVVHALAQLSTGRSRAAVITATRDVDADVRRAAWRALQKGDESPSVELIDDRLRYESDLMVLREVLECVRVFSSVDVDDALLRLCIRLLADEQTALFSCYAAWVLLERKPRSAVPLIRRLLVSSDPTVRAEAEVLRLRADALMRAA